MIRVKIGTHRQVGKDCIEWAKNNMPEGFELVGYFEECDIFISVLYDRLLSESEIASKKKCFNFHPGILPYHRGSGSYSWVIINNELQAGITLHEIDQSIDHGKIIEIVKWDVSPTDTAQSLFEIAETAILDLFKARFHSILKGQYKAWNQDEGVAKLYYRKELEKARDLTKFARAFSFEGKPNAYYFNRNGEKIELKY